MVIPVVKAAFAPLSATGEKPAIARAARLCGLLSKPLMDRVYALPKQARYQLRYTRIWCALRFLGGRLYDYNPKLGGAQEYITAKLPFKFEMLGKFRRYYR